MPRDDDHGSHRVSADDLSVSRDDDGSPSRDRDDLFRPHRQPETVEEQRTIVKPAKTSAAAVFSLVFGLSALLAVLTVLLAPLALVLGIIGLVLGVVGLKMANRVGVTGKGVAIGGIVLSVIAVLLAATAAIGVTTFLNDDAAVNRLEDRVQQLRDNLPTDVEVPKP